jgi:hypothetical protein
MNMTGRRSFVLRAAAVGCLLAVVQTDARADVDEHDPLALALGYKEDTGKVDAAKYPNHTPSQQCSNCKQFQGQVTDASGGCTLFGGKKVAGKGWCSSWVKKA